MQRRRRAHLATRVLLLLWILGTGVAALVFDVWPVGIAVCILAAAALAGDVAYLRVHVKREQRSPPPASPASGTLEGAAVHSGHDSHWCASHCLASNRRRLGSRSDNRPSACHLGDLDCLMLVPREGWSRQKLSKE